MSQQLLFVYMRGNLCDVRLYRREGIAKSQRTRVQKYNYPDRVPLFSSFIVAADRVESLLKLCDGESPMAPHVALKALSNVIELATPLPNICQYCGAEAGAS